MRTQQEIDQLIKELNSIELSHKNNMMDDYTKIKTNATLLALMWVQGASTKEAILKLIQEHAKEQS